MEVRWKWSLQNWAAVLVFQILLQQKLTIEIDPTNPTSGSQYNNLIFIIHPFVMV